MNEETDKEESSLGDIWMFFREVLKEDDWCLKGFRESIGVFQGVPLSCLPCQGF